MAFPSQWRMQAVILRPASPPFAEACWQPGLNGCQHIHILCRLQQRIKIVITTLWASHSDRTGRRRTCTVLHYLRYRLGSGTQRQIADRSPNDLSTL